MTESITGEVLMRIIIATVLALAASSASAQTIYKCKAADGTPVYSQRPCGADAAEVTVKPTPGGKTDDATQSNFQAIAVDNERAKIDHDDRACYAAIEAQIIRPMQARVARLQGEINFLELKTRAANNNLAGATYEAGLRQQIAGLHQSIATERSTAAETTAAERAACAAKRRDAEARFREKHARQPSD